MDEYIVVKSKWYRPTSTPDLPINKTCQIYGKLKDHHYGQLCDRLNEMSGKLRNINQEFEEIGYLLRELWRKYEDRLVLHETMIKGGKHEQGIGERLEQLGIDKSKINESETRTRHFEELRLDEKSIKEVEKYLKEFKFNEDTPGIYTDLVYDSYKKNWTKAYQYTFHEFFHNIDYLANPSNKKYLSQVHKDKALPNYNTDDKICQFGEIIIEEGWGLEHNKNKRNAIYPDRWESVNEAFLYAPLYDVLGGVTRKGRYPNADGFGHSLAYWQMDDGNGSQPSKTQLASESQSEKQLLARLLAKEFFAHMAATAAANQKAFNVMAGYLPNSYKMFVKILRKMVGIYVITHVR